MVLFVKILIFSKMMVKIGESVEAEISGRSATKNFFLIFKYVSYNPPSIGVMPLILREQKKSREFGPSL